MCSLWLLIRLQQGERLGTYEQLVDRVTVLAFDKWTQYYQCDGWRTWRWSDVERLRLCSECFSIPQAHAVHLDVMSLSSIQRPQRRVGTNYHLLTHSAASLM